MSPNVTDPKVWTLPLPWRLPALVLVLVLLLALGLLGALLGWALATPPPPPAPARAPAVGLLLEAGDDAAVVLAAEAVDAGAVALVAHLRGLQAGQRVPLLVQGCQAGAGSVRDLKTGASTAWTARGSAITDLIARAACGPHSPAEPAFDPEGALT
ncbi:MAG: hypothetical protein KF863_10825 [Rubrivivax sp.]|nr:hypothetical protein [Rubrivivax sp.]